MKQIIYLFFLMFVGLISISCNKEPEPQGITTLREPKADKLAILAELRRVEAECIAQGYIYVTEMETINLLANVNVPNTVTILWSSSDETVATVKDGIVTAIAVGRVAIKAEINGLEESSVSFPVSVVSPISSVELNITETAMTVGDTVMLVASVKPDDAINKNVTWSSSDESIATVNNGVVKAKKEGIVTITAKAGEKAAACIIIVEEKSINVSSISLDETVKTVMLGQEFLLTATVKPNTATNQAVVWESSDTSVAIVDENGKVSAIGEGEATITVFSDENSSISATCFVSVTNDITKFVYAQYTGGSLFITNGLIQYGSIINFSIVNKSIHTITVKSVQLIDGETNSEGNVIEIGSDVAANSSSKWSISVGLAGIHAPIAKFVYEFDGQEYTASAKYISIY